MLLEICGLTTEIVTGRRGVRALAGIDLSVAQGEAVGIVGESGSGKSMLALALMGLLPPAIRVTAGRILLDGNDLLTLGERGMRAVRGARMGLVFQEPMTALNPLQSIGTQVAEVLTTHRRAKRAEAWRLAVALLDRVGIPDAARRAGEYPHRLSGGLRQRAVIAMALACDPALLVADEPTTALDVTIQAQIMDLLADLRRERGLAVMLISHDLELVAGFADRVAVMYAGRIVEQGPAREALTAPRHPYTRALLGSIPRIDGDEARLPAIGGLVPRLDDLPPGCAFAPRCALAIEACGAAPPALTGSAVHQAACIRAAVPA
ncbi:ABC transporter ATP-binding protein [Falsiroseomonas sp. HW251]|uniref:ABC transporter ATP-binding protein n=1 Tax=Falsiroseomonas sp. HW251 TaxID=3390998 RepID=UPI003D322D65